MKKLILSLLFATASLTASGQELSDLLAQNTFENQSKCRKCVRTYGRLTCESDPNKHISSEDQCIQVIEN